MTDLALVPWLLALNLAAQYRQLVARLEKERRAAVIAALMPYAMPRLPRDILICFDRDQNQIMTLPEQVRERSSVIRIPAPRRAAPEETAAIPSRLQHPAVAGLARRALDANNRGGRA